jgi:hypothetical protein
MKKDTVAAPAEQGEGPTREWIRCQAEDVADYIRDTTLRLSTAPAGNKVVSHPLCKTREEAIDKVIAFSRALLASLLASPKPEAKVVPKSLQDKIVYLETICNVGNDDIDYHDAARALNEASNLLGEAVSDIRLRHESVKE